MPEAPIGVPDSFEEHVHLMMDLIALAFASDGDHSFTSNLRTHRNARGNGRWWCGTRGLQFLEDPEK